MLAEVFKMVKSSRITFRSFFRQWILLAVLALSSTGINAQRIININSENAIQGTSLLSTPTIVTDDYFGAPEQAREFIFNPELLSMTKNNEGDILFLDFFEDKRFHGRIQNVTHFINGVTGITARIDDSPFNYCHIAVSKAGISIIATIFDKNESYLISKNGATTYLCRYKSTSLREKELPGKELIPPVPPVATPIPMQGVSQTSGEFLPPIELRVDKGNETLPGSLASCGNAGIDAPVTIDVLIAYTPKARQWAANNIGIDHVIAQAMINANLVISNSNTNITFNLVYQYETTYTETTSQYTPENQKDIEDAINAVTYTNDGLMDEVHALRKQYKADLVILIAQVEGASGIGWLLQRESGFPTYAFSVSNVQQVFSGYTMIHEIGHNMGCTHHKLQGGSAGIYSYSHGWRGEYPNRVKFSTIMSYENFNDGQGSFPRIAYFSDPTISLNSTALGHIDDADNAQTLRRTKLLTSLYSDVINTSLTAISLSAGTLSPAFDPEALDYTVEVANTVSEITISGTANYSCATVTGNVTNKSLETGANVITLVVRSHDNSVEKSYKITVLRDPPVCYSYDSRPVFPSDITASEGDDQLNLMMNPAVPIVDQSGSLTLDMLASSSPYYIRESSSSSSCHLLIGNGSAYLNTMQFKVTQGGSYKFTVSRQAIMTFFDSSTPSCTGFITSNAYWSENGTSFYYGSTIIDVTLEANKTYYLRIIIARYTTDPIEPLNLTVVGTGTLFTESVIPYKMGYTYVAVSQMDNIIKAQSASADFRTLTAGAYTVYGLPYSKAVTTDPAIVVEKTLAELESSGCFKLSKTSVSLSITSNIQVFGISISSNAGGSVSVSSPSSPDGLAVPIGERVSLNITSDLGYELKAIVVHKTGEASNELTLTEQGGILGFDMPAFGVNIVATFGYNDDQLTLLDVRDAINMYADFTFEQADVFDEPTLIQALENAINDLLTDRNLNFSVIASDITIESKTFAIAGTAASTSGTDGDFSYKVTLEITGVTTLITTQTKTGVITAIPYDNTQDNIDITAAKQTLEIATFTTTEAVVSTIESAKTKALELIGALNLNGVSVAIIDESFSPAITGSPQNLSGTIGTYTFKANLNKGAGTMQTTNQLTLTIAATSYDPTQDNADISTALSIVTGTSFTTTQVEVDNSTQAKAKVETILAGLSLNSVTTEVVGVLFTGATAGTATSQNGFPGSYTFTIKLNKGGGTEQETGVLTLTIAATPYDATQDNADISAAKTVVEGATYLTTQVNAPDATSAKYVVETINTLLHLNGVIPTVNEDEFLAAVAGTYVTPNGLDGSYTFTVSLNKGGGTEQTTGTLTLTITATPYTPPATWLVNIAPTAYGTVTVSPTGAIVENTTVTLTITPNEGYELDEINAFKASNVTDIVTLSGTDNTRTFLMPAYDVMVEATFNKTTDQLAVEEAILLINNMSAVSIPQATANTEATVKNVLAGYINALPGMNATGITVEAADITFPTINPATEGTTTNLAGTNGSFTFIVTLKKTGSASVSTNSKTGVIVATAYDPTQDNDDIAAVRLIVEGANYSATQTEVQNIAQARAKVATLLTGLNLNGVITTVVDVSFQAATEGTVALQSGVNGSYKFTVKLNKGGGTEVTTNELTLTITATPYDPAQDNADISAAKTLIEGTPFTTTQLIAPDITSARTVVNALITSLSLNGVITQVIDGTFLAAIAGTESTPTGTNGNFTFTVTLNKGGGAEQITALLTLTITATPFMPPNTYLVTVAMTTNGQVTASPANPVAENATVTLTVTPSEGYELDVINAYRTSNISTLVPLSGTGNTHTFTMPAFNVTVEASFDKTADQTNVETAIALINTMNSVSILQATANTEATVKTTLAGMINILPGMSATGITVLETDIALNGFVAATAGTVTNLIGANGNFTFIVTLKKNNSASLTTVVKPGVIVATAYDPSQDNADIAAAKAIIEGATYTDLQANIQTSEQAKDKVISIIAGLSLNGVTTEVVSGSFRAASEGTVSLPNGIDGSYTFTIKLNKGAGTQVVTNMLTLVITATPYNASQDNNDISAAKAIVEGAPFITTQTNAPNIVSAKAVVEAIISALPLNGVTVSVMDGVFTGATAGTSGTHGGTNGSYTFTVELTKGAGTMQTTSQLTLTITATPYTQAGQYILQITPSMNGAVTADKTNPINENETVTLTITPANGYQLDAINAFQTGATNVPVALTGTGVTRTFWMPGHDVTVAATFTKTTDQEEVETAIGLINGLTNMSVQQETANTEATVKAWLADHINALPGMAATGIAVSANDISISGFNAATAGTATNQTGTNGVFSFFVTLSKTGSATVNSNVKNGVIIATPFASIKYDVTITATTNGTVTANQTNITAGTTVTLTITPATGYELNTIIATKTGDASLVVTLTGTGASRQLVMPAYDVTVTATFQKTADQLAVDAAITAIDGLNTLTVSQAVANTQATVKTWLTQQLNALPAVSSNGIVVSVNNITFSDFTAAIAGTASSTAGTNGSFAFRVTLTKGSSASATSATIDGVITATTYNVPMYSIYISTSVNGIVAPDRDYVEAGVTITLTVTPDQGYELESLTTTPTVTLNGTGNTRTFVMPSNNVTVSATFKKTQAQIEKEALEAVKAAIEGGNYRIAQGTGNSSASIRTWLINTLRVMFGNSYNIQLRSAGDPIIGDVTILSVTPAVEGTSADPSGINGVFSFTVNLTLGASSLTTSVTRGTIVAIPYYATLLKRIELLKLSELTARILNTGNVETGELKLALTGPNADTFQLPTTTVSNLTVGSETDIVLTLKSGLSIGVYKATLVVSGDNLTTQSLEITYNATGNDIIEGQSLKAWMLNDMLCISGLKIGQTWSVYSISGFLVHRYTAVSEEARIALPYRGVYIITSGEATIKVVY